MRGEEEVVMPNTGHGVVQQSSVSGGPVIPVIAHSGNRRAESLAARIEEGAARLAAFAEGLTDADWQTPISATDRRSVGVVVHHVASMYPVEIDLARTIAGRSEEHTSELQSRRDLVCRLLLEKKKKHEKSSLGGSVVGRG